MNTRLRSGLCAGIKPAPTRQREASESGDRGPGACRDAWRPISYDQDAASRCGVDDTDYIKNVREGGSVSDFSKSKWPLATHNASVNANIPTIRVRVFSGLRIEYTTAVCSTPAAKRTRTGATIDLRRFVARLDGMSYLLGLGWRITVC